MTIAGRLIEAEQSSGDKMSANREIGDKVKSYYLKCTTIDQEWKILDNEFGDQRKLMDELFKEITKPVKSDSSSLSRNAATILGFVNNMEQNGCTVTNASQALFVMSQLLSKLDAKDK